MKKYYTKNFIIDAAIRVIFIIIAFMLLWNTKLYSVEWFIGVIILTINVITMFFDKNYSNKKK